MTPTEEILHSLGRIEGRFEGVEKQLTEIHSLTTRVNNLENKNSKLYGALTLLGLLWTAAAAFLLKIVK
jgi:hypothetical protein